MRLLFLVLVCCLAQLGSCMSLEEAIKQMDDNLDGSQEPPLFPDDPSLNNPILGGSNPESILEPSVSDVNQLKEAAKSEDININDDAKAVNNEENTEKIADIDPSFNDVNKLEETAKVEDILNDDANALNDVENKEPLANADNAFDANKPFDSSDDATAVDDTLNEVPQMMEAEALKSMNEVQNNAEELNANIADGVQSPAGDPDSFNAMNNLQTTGENAAGADHDPEEEEVQAFNEMMADFNQEAAAEGRPSLIRAMDAKLAAGGPEKPQDTGDGAAEPDHISEDEDGEGLNLPGLEQNAASEGLSMKQEVLENENGPSLDQQVQKMMADQMDIRKDQTLSKILSGLSPSREGVNQDLFNDAGFNGNQQQILEDEIDRDKAPPDFDENFGDSVLKEGRKGFEAQGHQLVPEDEIDRDKVSGLPILYPYPKPLPYPKPRPCPHPCCDTRKTKLDLHYKNPYVINNLGDSIEVIQPPTAWNSKHDCSRMALLKVHFDKITRYPCPGLCINGPFCGHRMLRVDLTLHKYRASNKQRMFNIGDSKSNDGWGGDGGHQNYDAEIDGRDNLFFVYGNDHCQRKTPFVFTNALASDVKKVSMWISNEFIRVKSYGAGPYGCDEEMCSECLFALNGQFDKTINTDIYVALNRVVSGRSDRNGYGVCAAELSWACPWNLNAHLDLVI